MLKKLGVQGNFPNLLKGTYEKFTADIVLGIEKLNSFPLSSGTIQGCPRT